MGLKTNTIIPIDAKKKAFDKTQHVFMIKVLERECQPRGNRPQYNKTIYEKPTANSFLNGEKLEVIPLKSRKDKAAPIPSPFNPVSEVLAKAMRKRRKLKGCK